MAQRSVEKMGDRKEIPKTPTEARKRIRKKPRLWMGRREKRIWGRGRDQVEKKKKRGEKGGKRAHTHKTDGWRVLAGLDLACFAWIDWHSCDLLVNTRVVDQSDPVTGFMP